MLPPPELYVRFEGRKRSHSESKQYTAKNAATVLEKGVNLHILGKAYLDQELFRVYFSILSVNIIVLVGRIPKKKSVIHGGPKLAVVPRRCC